MKGRHFAIFVLLLISATAAFYAALLFGGAELPQNRVFSLILSPDGSTEASIIWKIRIPRALTGLFVGAGLAAGGAVLQGMLRNPLAEPYTLGISGGAVLGATVSIVAGSHVNYLPAFAFAGALISIFTVYNIASAKRFSVSMIILCGVIFSFLVSSLTLFILAIADSNKVYQVLLWVMGDLGACDAGLITPVIILISFSILVCAFYGRHLNILTLGEEKATHLGVNAEPLKRILFIAVSLMTGACVASCGVIGFVGLIIPHIMRFAGGPDHRFLIPASALGGGAFLVLCDTIARTIISPIELPVGVITGMVGGLFFIGYILASKRTGGF